MATLICTPTIKDLHGADETIRVPTAIVIGGVIEIINPLQVSGIGLIDKASINQTSTFGVLERGALLSTTYLGVLESLSVLVISSLGMIEVLAPAAALTDEFYSFVMNTKTGGFGEYTNFDFTSFFKVGTKSYGIDADGLEQLTRNNDNGTEIDAEIVTGTSNFGTSDVKLFPSAYTHMHGGEIQISVKTDELKTWSEPKDALQLREGIHPAYISMARGIKGVYVKLKISNVNGTDFEMAKFEQNFVDTGRKRL